MNGTRNKTFLATTLCLLSIFVIFSSINADESLQESFYDTYLQVVIKKLQSDPSFKNKLQKLSMTQIKNGQTSLSLHDITHELQNELHDVKRKEIDRLRRLIRARTDSKTGHKVPSKQLEINDIATHMDHSDPQYFTDTDIQRLLYSAMQNIQDTDVYRHERYKEHEMRELLKREEFLSHLSKRDRLAEEKRQNQLDAQTMRALKHNHPGSKAHFLNIWRTFDDMHDKFNAKTFFKLHDSNSDDFWDPVEVEILMSKELEQHYDLDAHPNDKAVMNEEMLRMREHFIEEVDIDEIDSMISEKEFMVYTKTMGFDRPELSSYKYIDELRDQGHEFNDKDLDAYKYKIKRHEMDIASHHSSTLSEDRATSLVSETHDEMVDVFQHREFEILQKSEILQQLTKELKNMQAGLGDMKDGYHTALMDSGEIVEHLQGSHKEAMRQMTNNGKFTHYDL